MKQCLVIVLFIYDEERGSLFVARSIIELKKELLLVNEILEQSTKTILATLKESQKRILILAGELLNYERLSLNKLAEKISLRLNKPYSTVKWNLLKMKQLGFFNQIGKQGDICSTIELSSLGEHIWNVIKDLNSKLFR